MRRYSGKDICRAIDCVKMILADDVNMLRMRRQAAGEALANYIFDLDDSNRTKFLETVTAMNSTLVDKK